MDYTSRLFTETIQRQALLVLFNNLNTMLSTMNATWQAEDDALMTALGRGTVDWTVEQIANENFYAGTIPSLINAPIEKYPNCAVICYQGNPLGSSDDTAEFMVYTLAVEIMVKSGPFEKVDDDLSLSIQLEQQVNSRIKKTIDAVDLVFLDSKANRTLNNNAMELNAPRVSIGDVFVRTEQTGFGYRWYWQGGVLEYDVMKFITLV